MASVISASTTSGTALNMSADTTGVLQFATGATPTTAVTIDTSQNLQFNSGYGSVATAYGCRAWVNFNGTGTIAIRGSGNITSLTDIGVGLYGINFTNSMPDVNYSASVGGSLDGFAGSASYGIGIYNLSTTLMNLACRTEANAYADFQFVTASIHR